MDLKRLLFVSLLLVVYLDLLLLLLFRSMILDLLKSWDSNLQLLLGEFKVSSCISFILIYIVTI
jgi:hypothetical protein